MKTIQLNLYNFNEMDKTGKEKALAHFRDINLMYDWWDVVFKDFISLCSYLGIDVKKDTIAFQGFYFQDNGCGFYGEVNLKGLVDGIAGKAWKAHAPKLELKLSLPEIDHRVLRLAVSQKLELTPCIIRRKRVYGVLADLGGFPFENGKREHDLICGEIDQLEKWLQEVAETLNDLLFQWLENEFDHLSEDKAIEETIIANDYLFMADGTFARQVEKLAVI